MCPSSKLGPAYQLPAGVALTEVRPVVETIVRRRHTGETVKVTQGAFTYVAIDENRRPRPMSEE